MKGQWLFWRNCTICISKCVIVCKNPLPDNPNYRIVFSFIGGPKHVAEFANKKSRDKHFKFISRLLWQNYYPAHLYSLFITVALVIFLTFYLLVFRYLIT